MLKDLNKKEIQELNGTDWDGSEIELVKEVEVMRTEWVGV